MKEDCEISNQAIYICELIKSNNDIFNPVLFEIYSRDNGNPEKGILEDVLGGLSSTMRVFLLDIGYKLLLCLI